jgi:hypothetical protein
MRRKHIGFDLPWPEGTRQKLQDWFPTKGSVLFTLLALGVLVLIQNASATSSNAITAPSNSTTTISYQGRLADSDGNPITTTVAMQFRLYPTNIGGSPLWNETHAAVPVENGLFHVLLGSVNPVPVNILAANPTLWLGIAVGADSEMTPREQLASAPYAMVAGSVEDGSITTAKLANGSVTNAKVADGNITSRKLQLSQNQHMNPATGTTSATTPGDLSDGPDVMTITLDSPQMVYLFYQSTSSQSNGGLHYMDIEINGVLDGTALIEKAASPGSFETMAGFIRKSLSAGQHTFRARYWQAAPGGTTMYWRRRMMVIATGQ